MNIVNEMQKTVLVGVVALVMGAIFGALTANQSLRRHEPQLAAMWLAQFHADALRRAAQAHDCNAAQQAAARVTAVATEIAAVFPQAYAQDDDFHHYVEQLKIFSHPQVAQSTDNQLSACAYDLSLAKKIDDACAACHRDYR